MWCEHGTIVLDLQGEPRREVLLSLDIAIYAAGILDEYAMRTIMQPRGVTDMPSIDVDSVENNRVGQVRLRFHRPASRFSIGPCQAVALGRALRHAASVAEKHIRCIEEMMPKVLLR